MPRSPEDLFAYLAELGIEVVTVTHPPLFTVAEAQALRGQIPGGHTKNLFLKDRKSSYFLLTVDEEAEIDLKKVHHVIGASGKVSFGRPDELLDLLGVINDTGGAVKIVFDEALMRHGVINAHPLTNEATTSIARDDLLRFVRATGHEPHVLKLSS